MTKLVVNEVAVTGKRVFLRVDFNAPMDGAAISDDTRIRAALPTINYLLEHGARVIIGSHFGRPKGRKDNAYSLAPVARHLESLLGRAVRFAPDCLGSETQTMANELRDGDVMMLENLRFYPGEESGDVEFARQLAQLAEVYVNDAFGAAHRAHASVSVLPGLLEWAAAGFLLRKEIEYLGTALDNPRRPFVAVLGGAKVSDKIKVIENLITKVDSLIIGGGMANTFLKAQGHEVGRSLFETAHLELAAELLSLAEFSKVQVLLPVDVVVAASIDAPEGAVVACDEVPADMMIVDVGPESSDAFAAVLATARMVIWNGPMGVFENPAFSVGTTELAKALAASKAVSIVGGGDSVAAVEQAGLASSMNHISTGGGASLEFLEGRELPGIAALTDRAGN